VSILHAEEAVDSTTTVPANPLVNFHHLTTPTLPHLLSLLLHAPPSFPPDGTTLLVIDSLSTLSSTAFPPLESPQPATAKPATNTSPSRASQDPPPFQSTLQTPKQRVEALAWASGRRHAIARDVVSALNRLAAISDVAVLVTGQMGTRIERLPDGGRAKAVLRPSMGWRSWEEGCHARVLLFRDWVRSGTNGDAEGDGNGEGARFAGLVKLGNVEFATLSRVVGFAVAEEGLKPLTLPLMRKPSPVTGTAGAETSFTTMTSKRKADEVADSESEDSGSENEDEALGREDDWMHDEEAMIDSLLDREGDDVYAGQDDANDPPGDEG